MTCTEWRATINSRDVLTWQWRKSPPIQHHALVNVLVRWQVVCQSRVALKVCKHACFFFFFRQKLKCFKQLKDNHVMMMLLVRKNNATQKHRYSTLVHQEPLKPLLPHQHQQQVLIISNFRFRRHSHVFL